VQDFADRLKLIRTMRKLSLDELAKQLHTSKQTLSRYENRLRFPKAPVISKFADLLHVNPAWLIGYDDDHPIDSTPSERELLKMKIDKLDDKQIHVLESLLQAVLKMKDIG